MEWVAHDVADGRGTCTDITLGQRLEDGPTAAGMLEWSADEMGGDRLMAEPVRSTPNQHRINVLLGLGGMLVFIVLLEFWENWTVALITGAALVAVVVITWWSRRRDQDALTRRPWLAAALIAAPGGVLIATRSYVVDQESIERSLIVGTLTTAVMLLGLGFMWPRG